jgi:hypothetical protein
MNNKTSSWLSTALDSIYGGFGIADQAARAAAQHAAIAEPAKQKIMGDALLKFTLGGLGLGLSGTRLYHMIGQANKPKETHTKFGPGAQTVDDEEKLAEDSTYDKITQAIGSLFSAPTAERSNALFYPAALFGTAGGLYGGHKLMSSILEKKRKEDLAAKVDAAKKEYQRALMGKKYAAAWETAFNTTKAAQEKKSDVGNVLAGIADNTIIKPLELVPGLLPIYATALAGTGLLSGKMTYDWTRARSKDKAFENARKARARLAGTQPIYVDPEQLAAIKKLAD